MRAGDPPAGDRVDAVVIVIDMQVDFFAHETLAQRRADLVRRTNELVAMAREAGAPVVWVTTEHRADLADASLEIRTRRIRVVVAGTPGAAPLPGLDVHPDDGHVVKKRYSAFFGTDLDERLAAHGCHRLVVAGGEHACVCPDHGDRCVPAGYRGGAGARVRGVP